MTTSPHISLVFVNYQSAWQISLALKSLFFHEKNRQIYEVIVVNNDVSERVFLDILAKKLHFQVLHLDNNVGFAAAANKGVLMARGHLLGFLNPDTLWCKESLEKISEVFMYDRHVGVFGMTLLTYEEELEEWSGGKTPSFWELLKNNLFPPFLRRASLELQPYEWVSGGGLFIRRGLFEKLSGFDEDFFLYFEDADICLRARKAGFEIRHEPYIPLIHRGGKSFSSRRQQKKFFYESQKKFFKKNRPVYESLILDAFHFILH